MNFNFLNKFILFFVLVLSFTFVGFSAQDGFKENLFCGDNFCSSGENSLNCYIDCGNSSLVYKINFDGSNSYVGIYNNSNTMFSLVVENVGLDEMTINVSYDEIFSFFSEFNSSSVEKYRILPGEKLKISKSLYLSDSVDSNNLFNKKFSSDIIVYDSNGLVEFFPVEFRVLPVYDVKKIDAQFLDLTEPSFRNLILSLDFSTFKKDYSLGEGSIDIKVYTLDDELVANGTYDLGENLIDDIALIFFHEMTLVYNASRGVGNYYAKLDFNVNSMSFSKEEYFNYNPIFWTEDRILALVGALFGFAFIGYSIYTYIKIRIAKMKASKYVLPNMKQVPQPGPRSVLVGKIGGSDKPAYFNVDDFLTHGLVAGSTGAGKSVTSSIFVEGVLDKNIPVVIFDPTAQWTGFLGTNKDEKIMQFYKKFGMTENDVKSYKGIIYNVESPKIDLDFKDYMNPGEVTIFNLNALKAGEYDVAVSNIVDTIFQMKWSETSQLRMLLVFDEIHRMLEKYGGSGGYLALEKAAREFRKWGIGVLMVSQVSADFKEALQGNVLTEIQLNTKSMGDIDKVKSKYGEDFAMRITRMNVGTGLFQNPRYNEGKPWFINIKPPVHDPHKLDDALLNKYMESAEYLKVVSNKIDELEAAGEDVEDVRMDLKLAKNKLKEGRFKMVDIYIDNLKEFMDKHK